MKFTKLKVLVSGCFDLLHAGHITFFETAAQHGDLYVCLGSDVNIRLLKGHAPRFTQAERLYLVQSVKYVHHASIASGSGMLDFEPDKMCIRDRFICAWTNHSRWHGLQLPYR